MRTLPYCAGPGDDVSAFRKALERDLATAIKSVGGAVRGDPVDTILYERTKQVAGQARGLYFELMRAANPAALNMSEVELIERFESVTQDETQALCQKIDPNTQAPLLLSPSGMRASWMQYLQYWRRRSGSFTTEILAFSPFLKREHAAMLMRVEYCSYFKQLAFLTSRSATMT